MSLSADDGSASLEPQRQLGAGVVDLRLGSDDPTNLITCFLAFATSNIQVQRSRHCCRRTPLPPHLPCGNNSQQPRCCSRVTAARNHFARPRAESSPTTTAPSTGIVDSDNSSVHTTNSLRGHAPPHPPPPKLDVDSHFDLGNALDKARQDEPSSATESPPPFSAHNFPSRYFPAPSPEDPYRALVTESEGSRSLTALASPPPSGPAPPFEESDAQPPTTPAALEASASSVVADTKAALPRDTKDRQGSKDLDDGEPPPPYTEGSSPLDGFTYVMAAAGSIITQVQQGGPAPINTALGSG